MHVAKYRGTAMVALFGGLLLLAAVAAATVATGAGEQGNVVSDDALTACVRDAGFADFVPKGPATLSDGSKWEPDESGRFEMTPAVVELMNTVGECRESIAPGTGIPTITDVGGARIEFLNSYHSDLYGCMVDRGWSVGDPAEDLAGMLVYGLPTERGERWTADIASCQQALYGKPGFPRELMPAQ